MGMQPDQDGGGRRLISEINVTPLVDVVLVLLIIFMVVTPMLQKGEQVDLPEVLNPDPEKKMGEELVVALKKDRTLWLGANIISEAELQTHIAGALQTDPAINVYLKGDKSLTYGDMKRLLLLCNDAGAQRVALATVKPREEKR